MDFEYHDDTPPQTFLDGLHRVDVPRVFDPDLDKAERANLITLTRKRMNEWQSGLHTQMREITKRYDASQAETQRITLAPYKKLDELGKELGNAINNLENAMKRGRMLPEGFGFGTLIFGEPDWAEWHFGDREEATAFEQMVATKNRMDMVDEEYVPMVKNLRLTQGRIKELKSDMAQLNRQYKRRKRPLYVALRVFVLLLFALFFLIAGILLFTSVDPAVAVTQESIVGGALLVLGVTLMMLMLVVVRRNRRKIVELQEDMKQGRRRMKALQAQFKQQRIDYYPSNELRKKLNAEYKRLRAYFPLA